MANSRHSSQIGRVVSDRYRLVAPLGAGASAQVYLADDVRLGRQVAVKMLQPGLADDDRFLRRFRTEAQTVANISHANVLVVHDWGEDEVPYLVTEYLAGGSLRAIIHDDIRLSPSQALLVGLETARGLAYAHGQGLVHRDLKPANLLFDLDGRLRIADFGLARAIAEASVTEPEGAVVGTARYAAPEQARGERLDGKADVYALAIVLIEAVTGVAPFASDTTLGTLMARIDRDLAVPEELGALRPALERAGRLRAEDRPDAEELSILLLAASERMNAPAPLPLVGALAEAAQTDPEPNEMTSTMLPLGATGSTSGSSDSSDVTTVQAAADATTIAAATSAPAEPPPPADVKPSRKQRKATKAAAAVGATLTPVPVAAPPVPVAPADAEPDGDEGNGRSRRGWLVAAVVVILALVAGGFVFRDQFITPSYTVPELVGQPIAELEAIARDNGWTVDEGRAREDGTAAGEILSTDPVAGESLAEGETLRVVVSEGNELTDRPVDIANRPLTDVTAEFKAAGLEVSTTPAFDEEIAADHVIGLDGEVPATLPKGEVVPLIVSQGPAPRTVPAPASGATFEQYAAQLDEVQLDAVRQNAFSETVPAGVIIRVETKAGTEVPRGSDITVVTSQGPELIAVPNVIGKSLPQAQKLLTDAGLVLGQVCCFTDGKVTASDPAVGVKVRRNAAVSLFVVR